jgi:predicted Zn-dependent protease
MGVVTALALSVGSSGTTRAQFDIGGLIKAVKPVSQKAEIKIGQGVAARRLGAAAPVNDQALQAYVNKIGMWLALQTEKPELPWRFAILDTDSVNAFAVPGGYVFVTRGMLLLMRDESELAGTLAHEISHVVERHALKTMRKGEWAKVAGSALNAIAEGEGGQDFDKLINFGTEIYSRGLDKKDEFAADVRGAVISARGGYDPYGLAAVLQSLASINPQDDAVALMFKTHPDPEERMDRLLAYVDDNLLRYADQPNKAERFAQIMRAHVTRYQPVKRAPSQTGGDEKSEVIEQLAPVFSQ